MVSSPSSQPFYRTSKNTWYCWVEGHQRSLGVKGEVNKKDAYVAWHRLLAGVSETPTEKPAGTPTIIVQCSEEYDVGVSLGVVLQRFLADAKQRVGFHTHRNYGTFLQPIIAKHGTRSTSRIEAEEVEAWSKRPEWSSSYRHGFIGTIISAMKWATTKRIIPSNPLVGLRKPPKASRGRKALITPDEHAAIVAHADEDFADFLRLLWTTGARPSEISTLRVADVDFVNAVAILQHHKTAHLSKERIIVLSTEALSILQRRLPLAHQRGGFFFLATDCKPMTAKAIGGRMRRTCDRAGLRRCIAYGYRHTFATDALSKGVPETCVSALLGHATTAMLHKHYAHLGAKTQALRDALDKVR